MSLIAVHKDIKFGVGDRIRVIQMIEEGDKKRLRAFEGIVIRIKGRDKNKSFTVRRIGVGQIGIERIFPLETPTIEKIEVVKPGTRGVKRAKLYYIREKSRREIEKIYSRATKREKAKRGSKKGSIKGGKSKSAKSSKKSVSKS